MSGSTENVKTFAIGGVHPADHKLSADQPIKTLPVPQTVYLHVGQHIGAPAKPVVEKGQKVQVGDLIAEAGGFISAPIHASVSGTVLKVDQVPDVTGHRKSTVVIQAEGDAWKETIDRSEQLKGAIDLNPKEIIERIKEAGIVGLGGAAFPSYVKLMVPEGKKAEFLTINAAECEPYLTADHRLMLEKGKELIVGIDILLKALNIERALVGIENNKVDAIKALQSFVGKNKRIEIVPMKTLYPQGGERQLVKALVDREIPPPPKGLPIDVGCVVFNIGTVFAVYEAVQKNKPLVERIITVTGKSLKKPSNFRVRIGTPIADLIEAAGGMPEDTGKVICGGPMMGKALNSIDIPVTKGMSGLLLLPEKEANRKPVLNCIRCGKCVTKCPLGLEPYLIMALTERGHFERAHAEKILNCCECGCCTYICPANRPLLDYMRLGKTTVTNMLKDKEKK
jgi:electron transport complex protein RnfC